MYENISISNLKKLRNIEIIDIRSVQKYNDNHIIGSKNIPFLKLLLYPNNYLSKNNKYYIYCQKGNKSKQLCNVLTNYGFNVVNVIGGYEAWILNE